MKTYRVGLEVFRIVTAPETVGVLSEVEKIVVVASCTSEEAARAAERLLS